MGAGRGECMAELVKSTGWSCGRTGRTRQTLLLHPSAVHYPSQRKKGFGEDGKYALDTTDGTEKLLTGEKDNIKSN